MKQSSLTKELQGITFRIADTVTENDVAKVVSNWTGIPVAKISGSETERLLNMENILHERIIGQENAVSSVSKAIRRSRVGLRNPNRPIASFMFAGPTGVGKTELTKALSDYMFGSEDSMIRLDMSEYMEKHTVAKLIGSPPGYVGYNEGGQLTEAVRSKPYSVILFDEVEKAHPDVFNLLLQILDDGRLTDSKGRLIDFTNALIVMTTNLGSKIIEQESGIRQKTSKHKSGLKLTFNDDMSDWEPAPEQVQDVRIQEKVKTLVNDELKNFFRPEFLNRIDEIIVFSHLTRRDLWRICRLMIDSLADRLKEKEIILTVTQPAQAFLTDEGYDPLYGARPLRRAIMHLLEDELATVALTTTLYPNLLIEVDRQKLGESLAKKIETSSGSEREKIYSEMEDYNQYELDAYIDNLTIRLNTERVDPKLLNPAKIIETNNSPNMLQENLTPTSSLESRRIPSSSLVSIKALLSLQEPEPDEEKIEPKLKSSSDENGEKATDDETPKESETISSEQQTDKEEEEEEEEQPPKQGFFRRSATIAKNIAFALFSAIADFTGFKKNEENKQNKKKKENEENKQKKQ
jgi:DNA polymerase III delta prime subunit